MFVSYYTCILHWHSFHWHCVHFYHYFIYCIYWAQCFCAYSDTVSGACYPHVNLCVPAV